MGSTMLGFAIVLGGLMAHQFEAMIVKKYGAKHGKGGMFFNAILCLAATVYFFATDKGGYQLPTGVLVYGLVNSTMYAVGFYTGYLAYKLGSFGLTRLFTSFGGIITIIYGVLVLREPFSPLMPVAVVMVFLSVFLMKYQKVPTEQKQPLTLKWVISVVLVVVSNALISIIGKMQHGAFGNQFKNEFLIVSFLGSALWLTLMGFIFERDSLKTTMRHGLLYGAAAGLFNGVNNVCILLSYNYFTLSFLSPFKTGVGMVITFLLATLLYKEKYTNRQKLAVLIGVLSIIIMNIK